MRVYPLAILSRVLSLVTAQDVYDYIIVGGGTAGLVLANRLTETEDVTVLVIEAGASALGNSVSTNVALYGTYPGPTHADNHSSSSAAAVSGQSVPEAVQSLNWNYVTTPQTYATEKVQPLPAGKGIGGSSLINGMVYTRAVNNQLNAWELAGNTGWNWESLLFYYKKSEHFQVPDSAQAAAGASYNPSAHGFQGLLATGFKNTGNSAMNAYPEQLNDTYQAIGIPYNVDMNGGRMRGFSRTPSTVNDSSGSEIRADAGRSYYYPFTSRSNLKLVQNTMANRIIWAPENDAYGNAVASAVEVETTLGSTIYNASREVIISCGTYASPALLERSGVGNSQILSGIGVEVKVDLAGVGENLMDQISSNITHQLPDDVGELGAGTFAAYLNFSDIFGANASIAGNTYASLPSYAAAIAAQNNNSTATDDMLSLLGHQYANIFNDQVPLLEVLHHASGNVLTSEFWGTLPFARGNVHSSSAEPVPPIINPNYWMFDYDASTMVTAARYLRLLFASSPLSGFVTAELSPGSNALPLDASDQEYEDWLKAQYHTAYHGIGTCIMLPREIGGVVSNTTLVYGTANVRVVDASIIPYQTNGHTQATVYALAEKASDIIKAEGAT